MKNLGRTYSVAFLGLLVIIFALILVVYYHQAQTLESKKKYLQANTLTNTMAAQNRELNVELTDKTEKIEATQADLEQMTMAAESKADTAKLLSYEIEQLKRKVTVLEETAARQRKGIGVIDDYYKEIIAALQKEIAEKDKKLYFCAQANDKLLNENSERGSKIIKLEERLVNIQILVNQLLNQARKSKGKNVVSIYFSTGEWRINQKELLKISAAIEGKKEYNLNEYICILKGFCDRQQYDKNHRFNNLNLSGKRSSEVARQIYLRTQDKTMPIFISGFSEHLASNGHDNNSNERRVEIWIIPKNQPEVIEVLKKIQGVIK